MRFSFIVAGIALFVITALSYWSLEIVNQEPLQLQLKVVLIAVGLLGVILLLIGLSSLIIKK